MLEDSPQRAYCVSAKPRGRSRIKVNILMEKNREEVPAVIKPHQRKFLTMPPFLRSQIGKMKD
uniref:Uncharacterized protein n=1 Tax=Mustela putorius furo TaxID=9669 RepID=M3XPU4_MUSPF